MLFLIQKILTRKILACIMGVFFLIMCPVPEGFAAGQLDDYFYPPEHSARMVRVTCRQMVPDNSPDWVHVLLAGLLYASSESDGEEMIAVAIKEQDYETRLYSVRRSDFLDYMNEKISVQDLVRKMYMAKVK